MYTSKVNVQTKSRRNVFVKFPFLVSTLFQIWKALQKLFTDILTSCNLKIDFTSPVRVKSFLNFKDKLPKMLLSGLAYMYKCGGCNGTYYGKTRQHFKVRICEHFGISHLTGKKVKISNNKLTVILEHLLCCNYSSSFEYFSILTRESKDFKLKIMESFVITCNEPVRTPVQACSVHNHHVSSDHMMFHHII